MQRDELENCIETYGRDIYSFCCYLTRSRQEADDLYQDTFLKALEIAGRLDADGNPKSALLSIASNLWRNRRRKLAWRQRITGPVLSLERLAERGGEWTAAHGGPAWQDTAAANTASGAQSEGPAEDWPGDLPSEQARQGAELPTGDIQNAPENFHGQNLSETEADDFSGLESGPSSASTPPPNAPPPAASGRPAVFSRPAASGEPVSAGPAPLDAVIAREDALAVHRAVAALPDKYRLPVLLFYMEEMKLSDIAALLRIPQGTVKSRLHKAKKLLAQELKEILDET